MPPSSSEPLLPIHRPGPPSSLPSTAAPAPAPPGPPPPKSAKALGKQRAVASPSPSPSPGDDDERRPSRKKTSTGRHLTVRFTDAGGSDLPPSATRDLGLWVARGDSVRDVRGKIRELRPDLEKRSLRLICAGRVLGAGVDVVAWLEELGRRLRKGAGEPEEEEPLWRGKGKASAEDGTRQEEDGLMEEEEVEEQEEETIWLQCAVGLEVEDIGGSEERTGEESDESRTTPLRGFDLLRQTAGLTDSDIANMRRQLHGTADISQVDETTRDLEDQWIDDTLSPSGGLPSSALENGGPDGSSGGSRYLLVLQGLLIGFFFPILPLFLFKDEHRHSFLSPGVSSGGGGAESSTVFERRTQMAVLTGMGFSFFFGGARLLG